MDQYRRLRENLQKVGSPARLSIYQGIVKAVDGDTCSVEFGKITVSGVKLRASVAGVENKMLVTPAIDSAVIVGSLSGDLNNLVVLVIDKIDTIVINDGKLGGLINIEQLTAKLNQFVKAFNNHTHDISTAIFNGTVGGATATGAITGITAKIPTSTPEFNKSNYEDDKIKH